MSFLALATWVAIGVLVVGSVALFAWFLLDAGQILHGPPSEAVPPPDEGRDER